MAKKTAPTLSFRDIVLGAEADVIRQALAAREQIDTLIDERRRAYERIAELETQVEDALGETGVFPFPAPPLPVAGFDPKADTVTRPAVKKSAAPKSSPADDDETAGEPDDADDDSKES